MNAATFILQLCAFLTVAGVMVLRWRQPDLARPYRTWGYPVTPLVFMAVSLWMLWHLLAEEKTRNEALVGLAIGALGYILYLLSPKNPPSSPPIPPHP